MNKLVIDGTPELEEDGTQLWPMGGTGSCVWFSDIGQPSYPWEATISMESAEVWASGETYKDLLEVLIEDLEILQDETAENLRELMRELREVNDTDN